MNEEKMKILKMLEEKKISAAEAMELLEALAKLESRVGGRYVYGGLESRLQTSDRRKKRRG